MTSIKYKFSIFFFLIGTISIVFATKRRPLVFVLCLKGFRWDLPYIYSSMPNLQRLIQSGSRTLWVESEFGGSQTNMLSLMSGLHVEAHARRDFIETIPVLNEHVGGHTRLFHWPWFDRNRHFSAYEHLRSGRKGQPEIMEPYSNQSRMSLQSFSRYLTPMINSLINEKDRTNLILSFVDEPFFTLKRHGIKTDNVLRTMAHIDRAIGHLLSISQKNNVNILVMGDHGFQSVDCREPIYLHQILGEEELNRYAERHSGTSFSFVLYPKSEYARRWFLIQLRKLSKNEIRFYADEHVNLPAKLRLPKIEGHPSPIIVFVQEGFYFAYENQSESTACTNKPTKNCTFKVDYSTEPDDLSMRTALLAHGPAFKKHHINDAVLMTDVYALLRQILCLSPLVSARRGLFQIHSMLDLTNVSNVCAHLYSSSLNMIKSVSTKPIQRKATQQNNAKLVYVNITEKRPSSPRTRVHMRVMID